MNEVPRLCSTDAWMFENLVTLKKISADKDIMDKRSRNKHGGPSRKVQNLAKAAGIICKITI